MISIIIPTLNEARTLPRLLDGLRRQGVPAEIVVVDGGSDDGTAELAVCRTLGRFSVRISP